MDVGETVISALIGLTAGAVFVWFVGYVHWRGYKQGRREEADMWKMRGYRIATLNPSASPSMSPSPSLSPSPSASPSPSPSEEWNGID